MATGPPGSCGGFALTWRWRSSPDTHDAALELRLEVVAALPPAVDGPDLKGPLQTTAVAFGRSLMISPSPRQSIPVTLALDRWGRPAPAITALPPATNASVPGLKPAAAVTALSPAENFPGPGVKFAVKTILPQKSFPETDMATIVAPLTSDDVLKPEGNIANADSGGVILGDLATPQWRSVPSALVLDLCGCPTMVVTVLSRDTGRYT